MTIKNKLISSSNFRDFDWNKSKLFYHISKCGSFTKAARLSGIDQSVLTRQIQLLEKQVGFPLLVRKVGGVCLTTKGEELLKLVSPFFLGVKGFCEKKYIEIVGEKKRKIRIVTTHALATHVIGDLAIHYTNAHPHVTFEIMADDHVIDVILSDADIAIRPYDPTAQGVIQDLLFSMEKKLYASSEYIEKYGEPKTVHDLKNHHLIVNSFNPERYPFSDILWILRLGMPEGHFHTPSFVTNSLELAISAAQKGKGIVSTYEEMSIIRNANLINILPDVKDKKLTDYFIYPAYLKDDQEIINIKNYLKDNINNY